MLKLIKDLYYQGRDLKVSIDLLQSQMDVWKERVTNLHYQINVQRVRSDGLEEKLLAIMEYLKIEEHRIPPPKEAKLVMQQKPIGDRIEIIPS